MISINSVIDLVPVVFQELFKELEVKSALKASLISSGTEILQLSEREHTSTQSASSRAPRLASQSEDNATSSVRDDPSDALAPESTHSDARNEGDAIVQDEPTVERPLFETSSSSDVPLDGNASRNMSDDATTRRSVDVVQVMALSPVLLSLKDHLTEMEHSWVELHADITAAQQTLHQVKKKQKTRCFPPAYPKRTHSLTRPLRF